TGNWANFDGDVDRAIIGVNSVSTTYNFELTPGLDCISTKITQVIMRTWTAHDALGNTNSYTQTIIVKDTTGPVVTAPNSTTVECDGAGNLGALTTWQTGASALDTCSGSASPVYVEESNVAGCGSTRVITAHWTATDACGNTGTSLSKTFTIQDTVPPVVTAPSSTIVECDGAGNGAALTAWQGGASALDTCSGAASPVYVEEINVAGCGATRVITAHWTATDACGN